MNIAISGMGYVGMSLAVLLAQHNHVTAVDILPKRVSLIWITRNATALK